MIIFPWHGKFISKPFIDKSYLSKTVVFESLAKISSISCIIFFHFFLGKYSNTFENLNKKTGKKSPVMVLLSTSAT